MLRGGIKSTHTKEHREDGSWVDPNNTLCQLLPSTSQELPAHHRPITTMAQWQAETQVKDSQGCLDWGPGQRCPRSTSAPVQVWNPLTQSNRRALTTTFQMMEGYYLGVQDTLWDAGEKHL